MTIRTFWTILIKILGISLVLSSLTVFSQFFSAFSLLKNYNTDNTDNFYFIALFVGLLLLTIILYILVLWLFLFRTAWLIDKLHLDKGFTEEKIELNIQQSTVLTIAVIVVGGLIFVESFPGLCQQIFLFFQQKSMIKEDPHSGLIIFQLVKTIIGYLLMTNSQSIIKFIDRQNR
jgi:hypothetical protein